MDEALAAWRPVWVVIDGSTDQSGDCLFENDELHVIRCAVNQGKGAAVRLAVLAAEALGFTHVLTLDADGQHCAADIPAMMAVAAAHPDAMVLGTPIFGSEAPWIRVAGRRVSNFLAGLATGWDGIGDALYGMRVYPVAPLLRCFAESRGMRGYDFDAEAAIRLCRMGVAAINMPTPVRYFTPDAGGVSHFRYLRDNLVLGRMFARLLLRSSRH